MTARFITLCANTPPPTLDLSFLGGSLDSRVTFTRSAGSQTYFNSAGTLVTAATNEARFDYDPVTLAPRGLLIEEARTNLAINSATLSSFSVNAATFVAAQTTAPDGTLTGNKLTEDSATSEHNLDYNFPSVVGATSYTATIFAKASTRTSVAIAFRVAGAWSSGNAIVVADLSTGTITSSGGSTASSITAIASGWYRIRVTALTVASPATPILRLNLADGTGAVSYTGNGTGAAFFWGVQLEVGAFPTSYIPTTAAAATRALDLPVMLAGSWFNASVGTLIAEGYFRTVAPTQNTEIIGVGSDGNNLIRSFIGSGGVAMTTQTFLSASNTYGATQANTLTANSLVKTGFTYALAGLAVKHASNGGAVVSGVSTNFPAYTNLYIGGMGRGQALNSTISRIRYWPRALTDAQLQAATR